VKHDASLSEASAYGSDLWVAQTLGKSVSWLRLNRPALEREGFPRKDKLIGLTLKADVEAFLARRRTVPDAGQVIAPMAVHHITTKESLHDL
jgi:hypothetical protein